MPYALATPRAFLFVGRWSDLAALTAATPHALAFSPHSLRVECAGVPLVASGQKSVSRGDAEDGEGRRTGNPK